ncbi:MAG TPA: TetR/AcrR family transcriptional regulator [Micropepsaceae bacterium]|nr:TetR/AcrR family transcriptional regulator [Micropepsaceae bacterium]
MTKPPPSPARTAKRSPKGQEALTAALENLASRLDPETRERLRKGGPAARWRRRKDDRPAELLNAALDLFLANGFAATRMEDIAASAGVTKGTVYLYFENKEAVFRALVREVTAPALNAMKAAANAGALPARDVVSAFINIAGTALSQTSMRFLPRLLVGEAARFPELVGWYRDEIIAQGLGALKSVLERGMADGSFRRQDPELTARLVIAPILFNAIWQTVFARKSDPPGETAKLLSLHAETMLRGLAPDGPATTSPAAPRKDAS